MKQKKVQEVFAIEVSDLRTFSSTQIECVHAQTGKKFLVRSDLVQIAPGRIFLPWSAYKAVMQTVKPSIRRSNEQTACV